MGQINQPSPSGIVEINGSKVFEINGRIKTMLSENIRESGYMTIEEAKLLTLAKVAKIYKLNHSSVGDNDMPSTQ